MLNYDAFINMNKNEEFYDNLFLEFFNMFYDSNIIKLNEKIQLQHEISLNENFYDTLKDRYNKAKDVVKNFSDEAKKSLETIIQHAKDATDFVKNIIETIQSSIKNIFTKSKPKIIDKLKNSDEIISKIREVKDKNAVIKELSDSKNLIKFYNEKFILSLVNKIKEAFQSILSGDNQPVIEKNIDLFQNPKNVIAKLVHGIESIPPFSWLDNVKEIGEKNANKVFSAISDITQKLGGPNIHLPIIAGLLGIVFETEIKGFVKGGLIDMVAFYSIPFVAILIKVIGWIATLISLILVVDLILDTKIFSHEHSNVHSSVDKTKPQQNQQPA